MKHMTKTFFKGLFTLLPLFLSVNVILWFIRQMDGWSGDFIKLFLPPEWYLPGMGMVSGLLLIYFFGVVIAHPLAKWVLDVIDSLFGRLPIMKSVYAAIKDFTEYLHPSSERKANQVVVVRFPHSDVEAIGLMTRDSLRDLPHPLSAHDRVAVYFPMSYAFGGYTLFVPREWVTPTTLSVEEAMRSVLTAWLPGRDKNLKFYDDQALKP